MNQKANTALSRKLDYMGISQTELAKMLGCTLSPVNAQCLNGIRTVSMAKRYARAIGCCPLEILEV